ncbi:hypothetical protein [Priestia abyssalis]|uniref:hypothetical protein n=1 Tax=Priestia abyssalis TaxID=1221450 RepID=UPI00099560C2|nr:hypothetical protein [Priestia abyssalis]
MVNREKEYAILVEKAILNAPIWLKEDIEKIRKKANGNIRISYVIKELYNKYTFNATHIFAAINQNTEWTAISRERLNIIDNNIDLIQLILKRS